MTQLVNFSFKIDRDSQERLEALTADIAALADGASDLDSPQKQVFESLFGRLCNIIIHLNGEILVGGSVEIEIPRTSKDCASGG